MSFGQNVAATKIELFKYKKSSQVAVMVQGILDDKRKVLLKNIEEMIEEAFEAAQGCFTTNLLRIPFQSATETSDFISEPDKILLLSDSFFILTSIS